MLSLGQLQAQLADEGYPDIKFLIVNSNEPKSLNKASVFNTSVPILQDTHKIRVWELYNATTDDMLIFDRYQAPQSSSRLGYIISIHFFFVVCASDAIVW